MIDWIIKNKEWLFSGIGVVGLMLLIAFGKTIYQKTGLKPLPTGFLALGLLLISLGIYSQFRAQPKTVEKPKQGTTPQITSIDPYEIKREVAKITFDRRDCLLQSKE